jgi:hypothetical protein
MSQGPLLLPVGAGGGGVSAEQPMVVVVLATIAPVEPEAPAESGSGSPLELSEQPQQQIPKNWTSEMSVQKFLVLIEEYPKALTDPAVCKSRS